ncbi:MAG: sigma-70 family RNA polymerase sigma factor [Deltaproteobacteria bacterium]|nr:sigma-70 family RNA polymerase sigma factor [Deltaproteobacteria bacterium]
MGPEAAKARFLEEERKLVERARHGDLGAFRALFERHADALFCGVVLPRLGNATAAGEVLRETFVSVVHEIHELREDQGLYAWMRDLALKKVIDIHRQARRAGKLVEALAAELSGGSPGEETESQALMAEERRRNIARVEATLAGLPPRDQEVIRMRLRGGLPREECARRLSMTLLGFDVALTRALKRFRNEFGGFEKHEG